jgi:hypothetical protein
MSENITRNFPTAGSEFYKYSDTLKFSSIKEPNLVLLHLKTPYNTHWEILRKQNHTARSTIRILYDVPSVPENDEHVDIYIVHTDSEMSEDERIGRLLVSEAKFFEIHSSREFLPLLIHIVDTFNKAHLKKVPTIVNTYKALTVAMVEEDEKFPINTFLASMLRNVPGISEETAKNLTREFKTVDGLVAGLPTLENLKFPVASGTRGLTKPAVERLRALFGPDACGFNPVLSAE